ncbi:MAG: hypothetical protein LQ343_001755 [Gyalolechia ehrenbergii]|nr:MAG: hypothetical protein LQ343_001755 [Gyalolechia ehrenbergii]
MIEPKVQHGKQNGVDALHEHQERNAWSSPGSAAFDFRSDVVTTPTPSMLKAIENCTLLDDVFVEDPTTQSLESYIAHLTGHESALLVLSGTMGNQLSIRAHMTQPPHSILADSRSHIYEWEAGGIASLSGAFPILVEPKNGHHLTLADVKARACLDDNVHHAPTTLISLENTLNGSILPLAEAQSISRWARSQTPALKLHLDGARLWEAVAASAGSLKDYCACFDSVSLCFSKGLGAPIGSIIVGSSTFITRARHIRKSIGGGLRQAGVIAAPARVAVEETFLGGKLRGSHEVAMRIGRLWEEKGERLEYEVETNMVWLDLGKAEVEEEDFMEEGVREGVKVRGGRCVVHYQVGEEGVQALGRVMDRVLSGRRKVDRVGKKRGGEEVNGDEDGEREREVKRVAREVAAPEVE